MLVTVPVLQVELLLHHRHSSTLSTQSCDSVYYPSQGVEYSHICGRAVGYAYATSGWTCAFFSYSTKYATGVTITRGPSDNRTHVWTYASGWQYAQHNHCNCPCAPGGTASPSFVGNNYFCESATKYKPQDQWYTNYTMWQGNCYEGSDCCPNDGRPWFNVDLDSPTAQDIEVRWCGFVYDNNNTGLELLELFTY